MDPEFDDFTPSRILLPAQLRSLRKLHDIADRSYREMRVDGGLRVPRNGDGDWTRWRAEVARAEEETMAVVRKVLGIGRYSVLHLIREGGYESWFQLRSVKLMRDRLEARGLVVRTVSPTDRRARLITPTQKGLDMLEAVVPRMLKSQERLLEPLRKAERKEFMRLMQVLIDANAELSNIPTKE